MVNRLLKPAAQSVTLYEFLVIGLNRVWDHLQEFVPQPLGLAPGEKGFPGNTSAWISRPGRVRARTFEFVSHGVPECDWVIPGHQTGSWLGLLLWLGWLSAFHFEQKWQLDPGDSMCIFFPILHYCLTNSGSMVDLSNMDSDSEWRIGLWLQVNDLVGLGFESDTCRTWWSKTIRT